MGGGGVTFIESRILITFTLDILASHWVSDIKPDIAIHCLGLIMGNETCICDQRGAFLLDSQNGARRKSGLRRFVPNTTLSTLPVSHSQKNRLQFKRDFFFFNTRVNNINNWFHSVAGKMICTPYRTFRNNIQSNEC